jgi:hypothetical protein
LVRSGTLDNLVIIVAFWLTLVCVYGGLSLVSSGRRGSKAGRRPAIPKTPSRPDSPAMRQRPRAALPQIGGLTSEVHLLRAEVEHLRSELEALTNAAAQQERRSGAVPRQERLPGVPAKPAAPRPRRGSPRTSSKGLLSVD